MRTHSTRSSHGRVEMASATLARAASFSSGATESSRSRKLMSAGTVGALAKKRSFDAGDDMHERRGRYLERSDMPRMVGRSPRGPQTEATGIPGPRSHATPRGGP